MIHFRLFYIPFVVTVQALLRDNREYKYATEMRMGAGTMDYAPHLSGAVFRMMTKIQTSNGGKTMTFEVKLYFYVLRSGNCLV